MSHVIISIIGRPNVGKSTLFNAMVRRRIAIVDDVAGTTRDRVSTLIERNGCQIELVDTGGLGLVPETESADARLWPQVQKQISIAIGQSHIVIFTVDVRHGLSPVDKEIAQLLRVQNKSVILAANKADTQRFEDGLGEFYVLGFGDPMPISALGRRGMDDLWTEISKRIKLIDPINPLNQLTQGEPPQRSRHHRDGGTVAGIKIAIVGKRNVGKSTLVNTLAKEERVIVSDIPGTTRDSIDVRFEYDHHTYIAIDTAGLKKRVRTKEPVEHYSRQRTEDAILRADVTLFLVDAVEKVSDMDKKIADFIIENNRPVVVVVNKWDLVEGKSTTDSYLRYLEKTLPFITFAPIIFISALKGFNLDGLFQLSRELYRQSVCTVATPALNKAVGVLKLRLPVGRRTSKQPRIYYATQVATQPPTINLVVNNPAIFTNLTLRYIQTQFQKLLPFKEIPIKILLKGRS